MIRAQGFRLWQRPVSEVGHAFYNIVSEVVAVTIIKGRSEFNVGGVQWLMVFVPSLSKESECDDVV